MYRSVSVVGGWGEYHLGAINNDLKGGDYVHVWRNMVTFLPFVGPEGRPLKIIHHLLHTRGVDWLMTLSCSSQDSLCPVSVLSGVGIP